MLLIGEKLYSMEKEPEAGEKLSKGRRRIVQQEGIDSTEAEVRGQTREELYLVQRKEQSARRNAERQEGMLTP